MDEKGQVDPQRSSENARRFGKDGAGCAKPAWEWCLTESLPPDCSLIDRATYVAHMRGERDGNSGDWGLHVRLANAGVWGRFVAQDVSHYRVQRASLSGSGRGIDAHYMYELATALRVPNDHLDAKRRLVRKLTEIATTRYLRDGERSLPL